VFNAWLAENGHGPWAKETFGPRFKQHDETIKHGVRLAKISKLESLSRAPWPIAVSDVPRRPRTHAHGTPRIHRVVVRAGRP
jgi:hypothetical protein